MTVPVRLASATRPVRRAVRGPTPKSPRRSVHALTPSHPSVSRTRVLLPPRRRARRFRGVDQETTQGSEGCGSDPRRESLGRGALAGHRDGRAVAVASIGRASFARAGADVLRSDPPRVSRARARVPRAGALGGVPVDVPPASRARAPADARARGRARLRLRRAHAPARRRIQHARLVHAARLARVFAERLRARVGGEGAALERVLFLARGGDRHEHGRDGGAGQKPRRRRGRSFGGGRRRRERDVAGRRRRRDEKALGGDERRRREKPRRTN